MSRAKSPIPETKHGTRYGNVYYGCKCDACLRASAEYSAARRKTEHPNHVARHGTTSEYVNYNCRCRECKAEWARSCREYYWRTKEAGA